MCLFERWFFQGVCPEVELLGHMVVLASRWLSGKESACQCRRCKRCGFDPWFGKIPWRRKWQPIPVFLPGESHGQRRLAGYSSWDHKELDTAEHKHTVVLFLVFKRNLHIVLHSGFIDLHSHSRQILKCLTTRDGTEMYFWEIGMARSYWDWTPGNLNFECNRKPLWGGVRNEITWSTYVCERWY